MDSAVKHNLSQVRQRIKDVAQQYQRSPDSIVLIAVSKTKPAAAVREAVEAGQRVFGESYLQEALEKIAQFQDSDIEWHFIGPVQSNKTRAIAEAFDWVHSVDRIKIAHRLAEQRPLDMAPLNICLQVNISNEDSKSGVRLEELSELVAQVKDLPNIVLRGLMAIPQPETEFSRQRQAFASLSEAMRELNHRYGLQMDTLSMGMSGDLEAAIAEGATMVRVGTDIFGERDYTR